MGIHLMKIRESLEALKRDDHVFVVERVVNGVIRKRSACVLDVMRGAARVQVEGESSPRVVRFNHIEMPFLPNVGADPIMSDVALVPTFLVEESERACSEDGCFELVVHRDKCKEHQYLLFKSGRARANKELQDVERERVEAVEAERAHGLQGAGREDPARGAQGDVEAGDLVPVEPWPARAQFADLSSGDRQGAAEPSVSRAQARAGSSIADLLSEARQLLELRRPIVRKLEAELTRLLAVKRELAGQIVQVEHTLDALNADAGGDDVDDVGDPEVAEPGDRERVERYRGHIDEALSTGPCTWNEIRAFVLEQHPGVDTRLLGSALSAGKHHGRYSHDGRRGGYWTLQEER